MIVRAIDNNGDWTFGAGRQNYKTGLMALEQDIGSALLEVLGDCFWATANGIDYFNLLGGREPGTAAALDLQWRTAILNRENVIGITSASIPPPTVPRGVLAPVYNVETAFSAVTPLLSSVTVSGNDLLDEMGDILTTEDGTAIGV